VPRQRLGGRLRERAARTDADDALVGFDQVAGPGQQEHVALVGDDQHRFQATQRAIDPPVLGELDGGSFEIAAILFELRLEAAEQRKGIGGRPGEADDHLIVVQAANLPRALLYDGVADGHLAVSGQHRAIVATDRQDGGGMEGRVVSGHARSVVSHEDRRTAHRGLARSGALRFWRDFPDLEHGRDRGHRRRENHK